MQEFKVGDIVKVWINHGVHTVRENTEKDKESHPLRVLSSNYTKFGEGTPESGVVFLTLMPHPIINK